MARALEGIRVIDLTHVLAGAMATMILAAIGVLAMPMRGNFLLLIALSSLFLMFSLALGLLISAIS